MDILGKDTSKLLRDEAVRTAVHAVLDHKKADQTVQVRDSSNGTTKTVSVKEAIP